MSKQISFGSKFGFKITAIIDCFELFIDRQSNLSAQAFTWSTYKSHNTAKVRIGITSLMGNLQKEYLIVNGTISVDL